MLKHMNIHIFMYIRDIYIYIYIIILYAILINHIMGNRRRRPAGKHGGQHVPHLTVVCGLLSVSLDMCSYDMVLISDICLIILYV